MEQMFSKPKEERLTFFIYEGPEFLGGATEQSRPEIIRRFGNPIKTTTEKIWNRYDGVMDTIYNLSYEGLRLGIYEASLDNTSFVSHVILEKSGFKTKWDINIGTMKEKIKTIFGKPDDSDNDTWAYRLSIGDLSSSVKFFFKQERVWKIEWSHMVD